MLFAPPLPPVAAQIEAAEQVILDRSSTPRELDAAGRAQQLAYRFLVKHPEARARSFAALTARARSGAKAAVRAGEALDAMTAPQKRLPKWRIVAPAPAPDLLRYYRAAQAATGVKWQFLAAIHLVETRLGRVRGPSTAGALGPMQFLPATWARYGRGDIESNRDSIMAAARLLVANGAPADMSRALYAYNHHPNYVLAVRSYAGEMMANARAFLGYHGWQVLYKHVSGTQLLPVGYPRVRPVRVD